MSTGPYPQKPIKTGKERREGGKDEKELSVLATPYGDLGAEY